MTEQNGFRRLPPNPNLVVVHPVNGRVKQRVKSVLKLERGTRHAPLQPRQPPIEERPRGRTPPPATTCMPFATTDSMRASPSTARMAPPLDKIDVTPKFQQRVNVLFRRFTCIDGPMPNQGFCPNRFHQSFEIGLIQSAIRIQTTNNDPFRPAIQHHFGLLRSPGTFRWRMDKTSFSRSDQRPDRHAHGGRCFNDNHIGSDATNRPNRTQLHPACTGFHGNRHIANGAGTNFDFNHDGKFSILDNSKVDFPCRRAFQSSGWVKSKNLPRQGIHCNLAPFFLLPTSRRWAIHVLASVRMHGRRRAPRQQCLVRQPKQIHAHPNLPVIVSQLVHLFPSRFLHKRIHTGSSDDPSTRAKAWVRLSGRPKWLWAKANMPASVVLSWVTAPLGEGCHR